MHHVFFFNRVTGLKRRHGEGGLLLRGLRLNYLACGLDGAQLKEISGAGQSNLTVAADAVLVEQARDAVHVDGGRAITLHLDYFVREQEHNGAAGKTSLRRFLHQLQAAAPIRNVKLLASSEACSTRAAAVLRGFRV